MMKYDDFPGPEKLLRDDDGTKGLDCATTCVANNVCIAFRQTESFGRIEPRVHASYDGNFTVKMDDSFSHLHQLELQSGRHAYRPGGRGKPPLSKVAAYCALAVSNSVLTVMVSD
jgi:hypothetical protein